MSEINRPTIKNKPSPSEIAEATDGASLAENSNAKSVCASCQIGVASIYDDSWQTPVDKAQFKLKLDDEEVVAKSKLKGVDDVPRQGAITKAMLGSFDYKYESSFFPPAKKELIFIPETPISLDEISQSQEGILSDIKAFESNMESSLEKWTSVWKVEKWDSVFPAYRTGTLKGLSKWAEDEKSFWVGLYGISGKMLGDIGSYLENHATHGTYKTDNDWFDNSVGDFSEDVVNTIAKGLNIVEGVADDAVDVVVDIADAVVDFFKGLWENINALLDFFKALAKGSIKAIQKAVENLAELPNEIGEIFKLLVEESKKAINGMSQWMKMLNELIHRTSVLQFLAITIVSSLLLMTPNFWAEMIGLVEGYIFPELVIMVIGIIIGALLSAVGIGEGVIALRIAEMVKKVKTFIYGIGAKAVSVIRIFIEWIEKILAKIMGLGKKLVKSIDDFGVDKQRLTSTLDSSVASQHKKNTLVVRRFVVKFEESYEEHIRKVEMKARKDTGVMEYKRSGKGGLSGGHSEREFLKALETEGKVVEGFPKPTREEGIYLYEYKLKKKKSDGTFERDDNGSFVYKNESYFKTVYSDTARGGIEVWKRQAQEAAYNASINRELIEVKRGVIGRSNRGTKIQIWFNDDYEIRTSYPIKE